MATTARTKDLASGKIKKGTSPSKSQTIHSQRSGSRQSSSSTGTDKEKSSTPTENKHTPNYLRPTASSSHDSVRLGKKVSNDQDNQNLLRRRSFDKPPSSSPRGQKALISPTRHREHRTSLGSPVPAIPREKKSTVRSSSFAGKSTVSSPKPVLDARASKTPKYVKQSFFAKNSPKKSLTSPSKKESNNNNNNDDDDNGSSSTKASSSHHMARALEHIEDKQEEKEAVINEVEEIVKAESDYVPKSENGDDIDSVVSEVLPSVEYEKINPTDNSIRTSEDLPLAPSPQLIAEESDRHHHHENTSVDEEKSNTLQKEENVSSKNESCTIDAPPEEVKATGEDQSNETDQKSPIANERIGDDQNKVQEGHEGAKAKEAVQELEGSGDNHDHDQLEEAKPEHDQAANAMSTKRQTGQGNKGSPTAYNNVIEETASKLLEKRKNKVKALVGAFQTVIDYETAGASK